LVDVALLVPLDELLVPLDELLVLPEDVLVEWAVPVDFVLPVLYGW
jgi:hypothetical protein